MYFIEFLRLFIGKMNFITSLVLKNKLTLTLLNPKQYFRIAPSFLKYRTTKINLNVDFL